MDTIRLGRTELQVTRLGFGALPIQRISLAEAERILRRAVDAGVNFIDTARAYTDSEEKIGSALGDQRHKIILATKGRAIDAKALEDSLHTSLKNLRTDYVDIFQFHNPNTVPVPDDGSGVYEAALAAKKAGKIRFLGLTAHSVDNAFQAARSGFYDTVQFPFSLLSSGRDLEVPGVCSENDIGFIAMKAVGGGLIRNIPAAFAFIRHYENVVPIWGIQRMEELEEFLALEAAPPTWDEALQRAAAIEREELGQSFCRGCGYCLPCPADIDIPFVARVMLMLRRAPASSSLLPEHKAKIDQAFSCLHCGACKPRCPYHLDTPELVRKNAEGYREYLKNLPA